MNIPDRFLLAFATLSVAVALFTPRGQLLINILFY